MWGTESNHHITMDGYVLTEPPYESYRRGAFNEEAPLHGYNESEGALFLILNNATMKNYEQRVREYFGVYADEVLALYSAETDAQARANWQEIYSAVLFSYGHYCWTRQALQNGTPVYEYRFTKDNGRLGANHSGEQVYFYGNIPPASRLYGDSDRALEAVMVRYFVNFISTGDPNGSGLPEWPRTEDQAVLFRLGEEIGMTDENNEQLFAILDRMQGWGA